jgi:hypothetical protein
VKAPGVTKEMVGRWQSKDGKLDCSSMDYVPFCGVSLEEKCGQTYTVQSGIGGGLRHLRNFENLIGKNRLMR